VYQCDVPGAGTASGRRICAEAVGVILITSGSAGMLLSFR
jgi:hypothetical protein